MQKLHILISQLEAKIESFEKINPSISNATVGWQIEHSLKTILLISLAIKNSNSNAYKWRFNKNRLLVSIINFIPRGKAKAPKVVLPDETITIETLKNSIEKVRVSIAKFEILDKNAYFSHPYFGDLNKKTTEWFLQLHTHHHLKIINDICSKR
jgi:hypothetical protein